MAQWPWGVPAILHFFLSPVSYHIRNPRAECCDVRREVVSGTQAEDAGAGWQAIAREPTSPEAAQLTEAVEQLFRGLDAVDRGILERSVQGYKPDEVAEQVGVSRRTVYRLLERIKGRLQRMEADTGAHS
jgi:RNA polymerase sigma factor (sigma-70 family)